MTFGEKIDAMKADLITMVREFNADQGYDAAMRAQAAILAVDNIDGAETFCRDWPWPTQADGGGVK